MRVLARLSRVLPRISLRSGFVLTAGVPGLLAVVGATVLLVIASILHRNALDLTAAILQEQIARDVELDVLMHNELANRDAAGAHTASLVAIQEQDIHEHFRHAHQVAGSEQTLSELEASVDHYFQVHRELTAERMPLGVVLARSGEALGLALRKASELRAVAHAEVGHTRGHIQRIDYWANVVAALLSAVVLMSILASAFAGRAFLARPVRALRHTIHRFSSGEMSARADEQAPRELRDVAHTFNQMASTIVRQRENELTALAGIAHDLNNPIGVLGMLTDPRAVERAVGSEERVRRRFALVHRQVERIHRMVQDLFDAVRAEAGALQLELSDQDLRDLAADAVELYSDVSELHEVHLSVPAEPVLTRCDPGRIEQALQNLIANAIKYSPRGGPVSIRVAVEGGQAVLSVSDEGIGLREEQKTQIFDAFQRFGPPGISGAGLGLSLVKRIVEAHGGGIEVDSVPGAGSTFRIRLSLTRLEAAPAGAATRDPPPAGTHRAPAR